MARSASARRWEAYREKLVEIRPLGIIWNRDRFSLSDDIYAMLTQDPLIFGL